MKEGGCLLSMNLKEVNTYLILFRASFLGLIELRKIKDAGCTFNVNGCNASVILQS